MRAAAFQRRCAPAGPAVRGRMQQQACSAVVCQRGMGQRVGAVAAVAGGGAPGAATAAAPRCYPALLLQRPTGIKHPPPVPLQRTRGPGAPDAGAQGAAWAPLQGRVRDRAARRRTGELSSGAAPRAACSSGAAHAGRHRFHISRISCRYKPEAAVLINTHTRALPAAGRPRRPCTAPEAGRPRVAAARGAAGRSRLPRRAAPLHTLAAPDGGRDRGRRRRQQCSRRRRRRRGRGL